MLLYTGGHLKGVVERELLLLASTAVCPSNFKTHTVAVGKTRAAEAVRCWRSGLRCMVFSSRSA
jgi:hypothetical protein